ncbi:MAG: hypothetical protein ABI557_02340 [Aureliella sp.]
MNSRIILSIAFFLLGAGTLVAQETPALPKPVAEHAWPEKFVGEWVTNCDATMATGLVYVRLRLATEMT